jgi:hypothetical protein
MVILNPGTLSNLACQIKFKIGFRSLFLLLPQPCGTQICHLHFLPLLMGKNILDHLPSMVTGTQEDSNVTAFE